MLSRNFNYQNPQHIIAQPLKLENEGSQKTKPSLQNMNELYNIYCSANIPYFPAAAATKAAEERTKALENYIKQNNLEIDSIQNLEHFFAKTKEEMASAGGGTMATIQILNIKFTDYIKNGYNPDMKTDRELENSNNEQAKTLDEILKIKENIIQNFNFGLD